MKKIGSIIILILILGVIGISGCTSSDNTSTSLNDSNSSHSTPKSSETVNTNSSVDTNTTDTSNRYSSNYYDSGRDSSSITSSDSGAYVANANTGVFHYASCSYVSRMKDSNKVYFSSSTAAENAGYVPCKVCDP